MKKYETKQLKRALNKIAELSEKVFTQEICGLLGEKEGIYILQECKNISPSPSTSFTLDPLQFILFKSEFEPLAIYHSHIIGNEEPSDFDIVMSENSCIPFMIYALNTKKHKLYVPKISDANEKTIKKIEKII